MRLANTAALIPLLTNWQLWWKRNCMMRSQIPPKFKSRSLQYIECEPASQLIFDLKTAMANDPHPTPGVWAGVVGAAILGRGLYLLSKGARAYFRKRGKPEDRAAIHLIDWQGRSITIVRTGVECKRACEGLKMWDKSLLVVQASEHSILAMCSQKLYFSPVPGIHLRVVGQEPGVLTAAVRFPWQLCDHSPDQVGLDTECFAGNLLDLMYYQRVRETTTRRNKWLVMFGVALSRVSIWYPIYVFKQIYWFDEKKTATYGIYMFSIPNCNTISPTFPGKFFVKKNNT